MKIQIQKEVFKGLNPNLKIAVIKVKDLDNRAKLTEVKHLLQEMETLTHLTFHHDNPKTHLLLSPWTVAQQEFGEKAWHYHTSVERLLKNVFDHKTIATKEVLGNIINYLSLKYLVPMAADDWFKIEGDLTFGLALGHEKIGWLKKLPPKSFFYADAKGVLGTKLDYWKNPKTQLSPATVTALVHLEALPPVNVRELNKIVAEAKELIKSFCGGKITVKILDRKKSTVNI